jgi:hypothetical protein
MLSIKINLVAKVFLLQVVFFTFLLCLKPIFHFQCDIGAERVFYVQSNIEILLEILLLLGLSFGMCYYLLKSNNMALSSLWLGLSLCFQFEVSKYVEHLLGFLPHYGDVPLSISILLSLVSTFIYMSLLYGICLLLRKI